jgi:phage terminase small subunit
MKDKKSVTGKSVEDYYYTPKMEAFAQAYVRLGNMSEAYRSAYNATKMKPSTIGVKASIMLMEDKFRVKVEAIRRELAIRNEITLDEVVNDLARMSRFDIAELYDEDGDLKNIHDMPKEARQMISSMDIEAIYETRGDQRIQIGNTKKIKLNNRLDVLEKLMKYFDGYNKHNQSKAPTSQVLIVQLPENGRG